MRQADPETGGPTGDMMPGTGPAGREHLAQPPPSQAHPSPGALQASATADNGSRPIPDSRAGPTCYQPTQHPTATVELTPPPPPQITEPTHLGYAASAALKHQSTPWNKHSRTCAPGSAGSPPCNSTHWQPTFNRFYIITQQGCPRAHVPWRTLSSPTAWAASP